MFAKVFITLALVCASYVGTLNATPVSVRRLECPQICGRVYWPVCATDGANFQEFASHCELMQHNCLLLQKPTEPFVSTHVDFCHTELVNGIDSLLVKLGNLSLETPKCMRACPFKFQPVCISNGKYRALASNECVMEAVNCALGSKDTFKVIQNDFC